MLARAAAYLIPQSLEEALDALSEAPDETAILGGGTWVVPELSRGTRRARRIVDLRRAGLGAVTEVGDAIRVGATTTYRTLERSPAIADSLPVLARLAHGITGGAQIRNQATVGGSACYALPTADVPGALVGLRAVLHLAGARGHRTIDARDFFLGARRTALQAGELLAAIEFPRERGARHGYVKLKLSEGSWPIVTALATIHPEGVRLTVAGVAQVPMTVDGENGRAAADTLEALLAALADPWRDELAPGPYRIQVAPVIAGRALRMAEEG